MSSTSPPSSEVNTTAAMNTLIEHMTSIQMSVVDYESLKYNALLTAFISGYLAISFACIMALK